MNYDNNTKQQYDRLYGNLTKLDSDFKPVENKLKLTDVFLVSLIASILVWRIFNG